MRQWQMKASACSVVPPSPEHMSLIFIPAYVKEQVRLFSVSPSVNAPCGLQCGGGGGGRGIVEIYNCSLVRQKWSHEIGQIAFLVNGSQEWRSQAENTDGMERPKLLVHIELLPHVAPPFLDVG